MRKSLIKFELSTYQNCKCLKVLSFITFILLIGCDSTTKNQTAATRHHKPNILFAIADDQSFPYASAYGTSGINTPAFDQVAQSGILFNNAFVAAPQCSPSRAAILTGKNIWELEEAGTHASYFPKKFTVFTDLLSDVGYVTGFTGKPWGPGNWKDAGWPQNPVGKAYNEKDMESVPASGINRKDYFGNFVEFMDDNEKNQPFFFWYGCHEPHRVYEDGSGVAAGKKLDEAMVPEFLPKHEILKSDVTDYTLEVEWFDKHLGQMMDFLEERNELDNTIIVVTADNGMPFPSAKANLQEYGTHVPLAISWPAKMKGNRVLDDLVALIDLAPTFLDIAGVNIPSQITGKSMTQLLFDSEEGNEHRAFVLTGRERHTHARPDNLGYPARAIRTKDYLYVHNFKPDLWPAGDPTDDLPDDHVTSQGFKALKPGYHDIDNAPAKTFLMEHKSEYPDEFNLAFSKRPQQQLYDISKDPGCINNVANEASFVEVKTRLQEQLMQQLKNQGDPRVNGNGDVFDSYPRISPMREFSGFHERGQYNPAFMQEGQKKIKF